ncbi:MAG: translation initiation factor IF-2 [Candidatus Nanoarchaeia archaeon]|nr:translation initiation factor IF-2 [Candidatus Nanoarchaeia archaeon]
MTVRQPIVCVVGHINHGKTTLLDKIRHSTVQLKEASGITQHIGASEIPIDVIKTKCGKLFSNIKNITIPGLLMIDTPGHAAFSSLRKRGSTIADLAILVININEGIKPQTIESIEILKEFKVPFVIAASQVDLINGWRKNPEACFTESFSKQGQSIKSMVDEKIYEIVLTLSNYGFQSERFDRIDDYTKQIAIIPCSGATGEGIPELLMVLTGLAQRFLEKKLKIEISGPAKGSVIEIKNVQGLGRAMDVVIFDGAIKTGDTIVIGSLEEPIVTKVRALLKPSPLKELREKGKFENIPEIHASAGFRISAPGIDNVVAGVPFEAVWDKNKLENVKHEIKASVGNVQLDKNISGVTVKADTLGALEASIMLFEKNHIPVKKASIGDITKTDIIEASDVKHKDAFLGVIMGFNVAVSQDAEIVNQKEKVKIITSNVIYEIVDTYNKWKKEKEEEQKKEELSKLTIPSKIKILPEYVFRQSNPAIVGVDVIAGEIRNEMTLLNSEGVDVGTIKQLHKEGETIEKASQGDKMAVSIPGAVIGRSIKLGEELITDVREDDFKLIRKKFMDYVSDESKKVMEEIARIKRKKKATWGL